MSRVAEALKRSRATADGSDSGHGRSDTPIRFFSGQAAAAAPWTVPADRARVPHVGTNQPKTPAPSTAIEDRPLRRDVSRPIRPAPLYAEKLLGSDVVPAQAREEYHDLGAQLFQAQLERDVRVVLVTSPSPGDGKTLTAANLALVLAETFRRRVLLVDADLRHPTVHEAFGTDNACGLGDSLENSTPISLTQVTANLSLLTAGTVDGHPMSTLTSDRMRAFVQQARKTFDWVILDTAPIGLLPDAKVLASMVDTALLVAFAGRTGYDDLQRATVALGADRVFGVVLNRVAEGTRRQPYGSYGYSYGRRDTGATADSLRDAQEDS